MFWYNIKKELLKHDFKLAMRYDVFYEDLPLYKDEVEVLKICYNGIIDVSGMCEVYLMMA